MANEQTSVPLYATSEILTAANMNISAGTGVPVFATTVTRDAAFGGANEKVLAEGQLCYLSATDVVQYYDGAAWATVGPAVAAASGLTLISTTTIGTTVSSVTVSSAFSATYDNYRITVAGGTNSAGIGGLAIQLGSTVTGYYFAVNRLTYANSASNEAGSNVTTWGSVGGMNTNGLGLSMDLISPFLAKNTFYYSTQVANGTTSVAGAGGGWVDNTTSYTAFTVIPTSGTLTGGTIRVYGYQNS